MHVSRRPGEIPVLWGSPGGRGSRGLGVSLLTTACESIAPQKEKKTGNDAGETEGSSLHWPLCVPVTDT